MSLFSFTLRTKHCSERTYFLLSVFLLSVFGIALLASIPPIARAEGVATFSINPPTGTFGVGKSFTVGVVVDSPQGFNSASAVLKFDPSKVSVTSVSKTSSAFSLWAVEPSSDNTKGSVSFEGGNTTPLTGKNTLLSVTFKTLAEGTTEISFTSGSILAADGKGTDIAGTKNSASIEISASAPVEAPPPPPPVATGPKPDLPEVTVLSHPDERLYYGIEKAKFTWDLPSDVIVVRLSLDTKEDTTPTTSYDPAISEKEFDQLIDGVMYFHLRYQNDAGWGPTVHKKIMVDKTPPLAFTLNVTTDASSTDVLLEFNATDTLSGVDRYEVIVDTADPIKVPLSGVVNGKYTLKNQLPGDHTVKVKAIDKAGNNMIAEGKFLTVEDPSIAAKKNLEEAEPEPTDWRLIGDIALIALLAFMIGYMWYERSAFRHEKYLVKREADELRDNLGNIFAALREEMGEQAGRLFQKPNPSAQDREVMISMNEAVDLSEELLSKEVEDVRKLLS